jgi:hypothetical protein
MKFHHHQLFVEKIALLTIRSPIVCPYNKLSATCQPGLFGP